MESVARACVNRAVCPVVFVTSLMDLTAGPPLARGRGSEEDERVVRPGKRKASPIMGGLI
jgi:hypothetical protein